MPTHDWSRVTDATFHDFHYSWVLEVKRALKRGLLPPGYYVMAEQFGGDVGAPDVLKLQQSAARDDAPDPPANTATLTESPPVVHARQTFARAIYPRLQRTLVVRHTSDDRIVAMIEILSRGNKANRHGIQAFLDKVAAALEAGIHLLLIDVHPPGPRDPHGIHGAVLGEISDRDYVLDRQRPFTSVAHISGVDVEAFVEHFAVGEALPEMPLFLTGEHYIKVPLESTYMAAWEDVPPQHQETLRS